MNNEQNNKQQLAVKKQGWFYGLGKRIKWMPPKKKLFYSVNLLVLVVIAGGLIINDYLKQPEGKVLAEYTPAQITFEGPVNIVPGVDSVSFSFYTSAPTTCSVVVSYVGGGVSPNDDDYISNNNNNGTHLFSFTDLNNSPDNDELPVEYYYQIECYSGDPSNPLMDVGVFTTLSFQPGGDLEITGRTIDVTANSAVINWETNKAATSRVYLIVDGGYRIVADNSNLSMLHSETIISLEPRTLYTYYIMSATSAGETCLPSLYPNSESCMATIASIFMTDTNLEISDSAVEAGANRAIFSWHTNKASNSWVWIDGMTGQGNNAQVTDHYVEVAGLTTSQNYNYFVSSGIGLSVICGDGNIAVSSDNCAATADANFMTVVAGSVDANVILRVNRDRICDQWLYCNAAVQVVNNKGADEDVCFSVGLCDEMDEGGNCANIVDNAFVGNSNGELTFMATELDNEVGEIKNLSGYSKVGLDWGQRCSMSGVECNGDGDCILGNQDTCEVAKIDGYYPYNIMQEVGLPISIANFGFETGSTRPWQAYEGAAIEIDKSKQQDKALKVDTSGNNTGIVAYEIVDDFDINNTYVVSFKAKTLKDSGLQRVKVQLGATDFNGNFIAWEEFRYYNPRTGTTNNYIDLTTVEQEYILSLEPSLVMQNPVLNILITEEDNGTTDNQGIFVIDDINMKTVLKVGAMQSYIARSCRMYPDKNATACSYYNERDNKDMRGWQGYCVEPDPGYNDKNQPLCLQWWPIDVITGEANIFSEDEVVGYSEVTPLYYCVEAESNYPYYQRMLGDTWLGRATDDNPINRCDQNIINVASLGILKDEIIEIRIDGIRIDAQGTDFNNDGCGIAKEFDSLENPAIENKTYGGSGALIFNIFNKDYWDNSFDDIFPDDTIYNYNKYASLECYGTSNDDEENFVTAYLSFTERDILNTITYKYCDGENGDGASRYSNINITFKGARCNVIAQVVTPDGENKAWTERIKDGGWTQNNQIGYKYEQDYAPYGASVTAGLDDNPANWEEALYVMPANSSMGGQRPYQIRAGAPYSIDGVLTFRCDGGPNNGLICTNDNFCNTSYGECVEQYDTCYPYGDDEQCIPFCDSLLENCCTNDVSLDCVTNEDCDNYSSGISSCVAETIIFGKTQCVAGSMNLGKECKSASDCGGADAWCAGINLTTDTVVALSGGRTAGLNRISNLFAEIYGVWEWRWDPNIGKYRYWFNDDLGGDYSIGHGTEPRITDIKVNDSENEIFEIVGQGSAVLKFASLVSPNQLPLTDYSVDWGDGTSLVEAGLRIGNDSNPHTLVHYYKYDPACEYPTASYTGDYCDFYPEITIKDNWGFSVSQSFGANGGSIRVYQP